MNQEDKIKEYIQRAKDMTHTNHNYSYDWTDILIVAQMLQREEHFNKSKE